MRINNIDNVVFRSGYPTFGVGHLSYKPETPVLRFKPSGILKEEPKKLDYLA